MSFLSGFLDNRRSWRAMPVDPGWRRDGDGTFHRLAEIDVDAAALRGQGGVFVLWHGGIRPRWVNVGATDDLGAALAASAQDTDVRGFEVHGGLFATWCLLPAEDRAGVEAYLRSLMCPILHTAAEPARLWPRRRVVPVLMPL